MDWERDLRAERPTLEAMTRTMSLRGPDTGGLWVSQRAFLGHRRLAVIDLVGGQQPMESDDAAATVISYSGEVYNFSELRTELAAHGHRFRSRSDTEVVLRAYLQWGVDCVARFNGMCAFAIWDEPRSELLLVRDRLGIKPLYYYPYGGGMLFGSEPKAVLANPLFSPELDDEGIAELFVLPNAPTPGHGVYRGLRQVRPGHVVRANRRGVEEMAYWKLRPNLHTDDLETTTQRVRALLSDTVSRQMVADVPLGSLLSGGVDSSAITALAAEKLAAHGAGKISTYSVDFPNSESSFRRTEWHDSLDEPYVAQVAAHVGSQHTTIVVQPEDVLAFENRVLMARDLPGWGEMDVSLYLLFAKVREHATVALSGESADEVFGGYPFFRDPAALSHDGFPWMAGKQGPSALLTEDVRRRVRPLEYAHDSYRRSLGEVPKLGQDTREDARIREVAYLALTRWLPALLDRKDRMSMASGLEVRVPFCDHRLVEYLWNVPWSMKTAGDMEKGLLRRAVRDLLPAQIVHRRKSAFPANPHPGYVRSLRERVDELLLDVNAPVFDLVDRVEVRRRLNAGEPLPSPRASSSQTAGLNFLLNVNSWLRTYRVRIH
ncbi:asparagine synthase (glutamine-hydrolyzing) [Pendulispora rubella]|uniref:asparagine synthase (glutamine-hydrolyzing) n=1 Tax=Pendulispora rubella TaxID=2741070 RepID=A0ABZ2LLM4_9BACT